MGKHFIRPVSNKDLPCRQTLGVGDRLSQITRQGVRVATQLISLHLRNGGHDRISGFKRVFIGIQLDDGL